MEEDIKILESYLEDLDVMIAYDKDEKDINIKQAIEHLIARNKELEEKMNFVQPFVSLTNRMVDKILGDNDYIPKSKAREKIEELDLAIHKNQTTYSLSKMQEINFARICLAELLED